VTASVKSVKAVKAPAARAAEPADSRESLLLRRAAASYAFPALEGVANQFARSLRDLVRALGAPTIQVERAGAEQLSFAEWSAAAAPAKTPPPVAPGQAVAVLAGGCVWSVEQELEQIPGVVDVVVG